MAGSRGTSRKKSGAAEQGLQTPADALRWIEEQGVVLESARGKVPSLAATVAGESIRGSWWSHPKSQHIFRLSEAIRDSADVVTCRLVDGKITFVHRRLWPALVRLAGRFAQDRLAKVVSEHTPSGKHVSHQTPFSEWVPRDVVRAGKKLSVEEAEKLMSAVIRSA